MAEFVFRQATVADIADIMPIIIQARDRMLADGKRQWTREYPAQRDIEADIGRGWGMCCACVVQSWPTVQSLLAASRHIMKLREVAG